MGFASGAACCSSSLHCGKCQRGESPAIRGSLRRQSVLEGRYVERCNRQVQQHDGDSAFPLLERMQSICTDMDLLRSLRPHVTCSLLGRRSQSHVAFHAICHCLASTSIFAPTRGPCNNEHMLFSLSESPQHKTERWRDAALHI